MIAYKLNEPHARASACRTETSNWSVCTETRTADPTWTFLLCLLACTVLNWTSDFGSCLTVFNRSSMAFLSRFTIRHHGCIQYIQFILITIAQLQPT